MGKNKKIILRSDEKIQDTFETFLKVPINIKQYNKDFSNYSIYTIIGPVEDDLRKIIYELPKVTNEKKLISFYGENWREKLALDPNIEIEIKDKKDSRINTRKIIENINKSKIDDDEILITDDIMESAIKNNSLIISNTSRTHRSIYKSNTTIKKNIQNSIISKHEFVFDVFISQYDTIHTIKLKIQDRLKIPSQCQHLFYEYNNKPLSYNIRQNGIGLNITLKEYLMNATHKVGKNKVGGSEDPDGVFNITTQDDGFTPSYNNEFNKNMQEEVFDSDNILGIGIDINYYNNYSDMYIESLDLVTKLHSFDLGLMDLRDIISNGENGTIDNLTQTELNVLFYGFVILFWPYCTTISQFIKYINGDSDDGDIFKLSNENALISYYELKGIIQEEDINKTKEFTNRFTNSYSPQIRFDNMILKNNKIYNMNIINFRELLEDIIIADNKLNITNIIYLVIRNDKYVLIEKWIENQIEYFKENDFKEYINSQNKYLLFTLTFIIQIKGLKIKLIMYENGKYTIIIPINKSFDSTFNNAISTRFIDNIEYIKEINKVIEYVNTYDRLFISNYRYKLLEVYAFDELLYNINITLNYNINIETIKPFLSLFQNLGFIEYGKDIQLSLLYYYNSYNKVYDKNKFQNKLGSIQNECEYMQNFMLYKLMLSMYNESYTIRIHEKSKVINMKIANMTIHDIPFINMLVKYLTYKIIQEVNRKTNLSNNNIKLKVSDPILFAPRGDFTYSTFCQKGFQPVIGNKEDYKPNDKSMVKTKNITYGTDAYYKCPNKNAPFIKEIHGKHPDGYCVWCCGKTEYYHKNTIQNHTELNKDDRGIRYIMNFGKAIEINRLCYLPPELNSIISIDNDHMYLIGVKQYIFDEENKFDQYVTNKGLFNCIQMVDSEYASTYTISKLKKTNDFTLINDFISKSDICVWVFNIVSINNTYTINLEMRYLNNIISNYENHLILIKYSLSGIDYWYPIIQVDKYNYFKYIKYETILFNIHKFAFINRLISLLNKSSKSNVYKNSRLNIYNVIDICNTNNINILNIYSNNFMVYGLNVEKYGYIPVEYEKKIFLTNLPYTYKTIIGYVAEYSEILKFINLIYYKNINVITKNEHQNNKFNRNLDTKISFTITFYKHYETNEYLYLNYSINNIQSFNYYFKPTKHIKELHEISTHTHINFAQDDCFDNPLEINKIIPYFTVDTFHSITTNKIKIISDHNKIFDYPIYKNKSFRKFLLIISKKIYSNKNLSVRKHILHDVQEFQKTNNKNIFIQLPPKIQHQLEYNVFNSDFDNTIYDFDAFQFSEDAASIEKEVRKLLQNENIKISNDIKVIDLYTEDLVLTKEDYDLYVDYVVLSLQNKYTKINILNPYLYTFIDDFYTIKENIGEKISIYIH